MADDVDLAQERDAKMLESLIAARKPEGPQANGKCFTCSSPLPLTHRWCDAACRDNYERSFRFLHHRR